MKRPALGRALLGLTSLAVATVGLTTGAPASSTTAQAGQSGATETYVVLATEGASDTAVRQAVADAGGQVTAVNGAVGVYTVDAPADTFATAVAASPAVD